MKNIADLHLHTTYSDGMLTPSEMIQSAAENGLRTVAVTDHDTVEGMMQALDAGQRVGITVIPGIEVSASIDGKEVHILGYYFDWKFQELLDVLALLKRERLLRAEQIVEKLNKMRIAVKLERVLELAGDGVVARPHIARAMVERGFASSYAHAFAKYLSDGRPAYVNKPSYPAEQAIDLIRSAGGLSAIAHPGHTVSENEMMRLIRFGVDGIEIMHPSHTPDDVQYYRGIASEYHLLETGGSDYHGGIKESDQLFGKVFISAAAVDAMRYRLHLEK